MCQWLSGLFDAVQSRNIEQLHKAYSGFNVECETSLEFALDRLPVPLIRGSTGIV